MTELKPCPFCGGKAEVASDEYRQEYINPLFGSVTLPAASKAWAYCTECGAMGRVVRDKDYDGYKNVEREERLKEEAIEAWNNRVPQTWTSKAFERIGEVNKTIEVAK